MRIGCRVRLRMSDAVSPTPIRRSPAAPSHSVADPSAADFVRAVRMGPVEPAPAPPVIPFEQRLAQITALRRADLFPKRAAWPSRCWLSPSERRRNARRCIARWAPSSTRPRRPPAPRSGQSRTADSALSPRSRRRREPRRPDAAAHRQSVEWLQRRTRRRALYRGARGQRE